MPRKPIKTAPPPLQLLIDKANLLPKSNKDLYEFRDKMRPILQKCQERSWPKISVAQDVGEPDPDESEWDRRNMSKKLMYEWINKQFRREVPEHLLPLARFLGATSPAGMDINLEDLNTIRAGLLQLIEAAERARRFGHTAISVKLTASVLVMADGSVTEYVDTPLTTILKHGIPVDRLRLCPICERIFWQHTTRSETCGFRECAIELGKQKRRSQG